MTTRSAASRLMPPMARMARSCCRFLIFIGASLDPLKVERELQRRVAADRINLHVADLFGRTQLIDDFVKGLPIPRRSGTTDHRRIANFERLDRRSRTVLGKCLGQLFQNAQAAE